MVLPLISFFMDDSALGFASGATSVSFVLTAVPAALGFASGATSVLFVLTAVPAAGCLNASRLILVGKSEWERGMVRVKVPSTREEFEVKAGELE